MIKTGAVKINIDKGKCRFSMWDPTGCKKCLEICPQAVFSAVPEHEYHDFSIPKDQQWEPQKWILVTTWEPLCSACGLCIKDCPNGAIGIQIDGKNI